MISFRTDLKPVKRSGSIRSGRWKALIVLNICLAVMCAVVFGISAFSVRANAAAYDSGKAPADEWYELSEDGKALDIHLDSSLDNYEWKYGVSNDNIKELHYMELSDSVKASDQGHDWNAHFKVNSLSGDTVLTFQYLHDLESHSIDTRTLAVHIEDGVMALK